MTVLVQQRDLHGRIADSRVIPIDDARLLIVDEHVPHVHVAMKEPHRGTKKRWCGGIDEIMKCPKVTNRVGESTLDASSGFCHIGMRACDRIHRHRIDAYRGDHIYIGVDGVNLAIGRSGGVPRCGATGLGVDEVPEQRARRVIKQCRVFGSGEDYRRWYTPFDQQAVTTDRDLAELSARSRDNDPPVSKLDTPHDIVESTIGENPHRDGTRHPCELKKLVKLDVLEKRRHVRGH